MFFLSDVLKTGESAYPSTIIQACFAVPTYWLHAYDMVPALEPLLSVPDASNKQQQFCRLERWERAPANTIDLEGLKPGRRSTGRLCRCQVSPTRAERVTLMPVITYPTCAVNTFHTSHEWTSKHDIAMLVNEIAGLGTIRAENVNLSWRQQLPSEVLETGRPPGLCTAAPLGEPQEPARPPAPSHSLKFTCTLTI